MQNLPRDRRQRFWLVFAFLLAIFFLSLGKIETQRARWYEQALYNLVYPFQISAEFISTKFHNAWSRYIYLRNVVDSNSQLQKKVHEQTLELSKLKEQIKVYEHLGEFLKYVEGGQYNFVVAKVVANDPRSEFKSIVINKGYKEGIRKDDPVIAEGGLIGRVAKMNAGTSIVLLITDPNNYVDIVVQRSRARALLVGTGYKTELRPLFYLSRLEYLRRISDINVGDVIVTSGLDQVYPYGLPIGEVTEIENNEYGVFKEALILPFADMSQVEEVLVLHAK